MTGPDLHCTECQGPLEYEDDRFLCGNMECAALGMEIPVWRALKDAGLAVPPVVGLPRPDHNGLPVPWVAPRTRARVWWRALDAERLAAAHNEWRCQVCGEALPDEAWVLATPEGAVLQAALHEACMHLALKFCPHLASEATRAAGRLVTREQLAADGRSLSQATPSDPHFLQQWELAVDPLAPEGTNAGKDH
ncbi:hypothetical protein [Streptomyces sp. NPDC058861]|uniref:hypothetical protein n=1 Tax=Streptomyces sp. NPDC058861 TaxID=3346653 RepID=UPI0036D189B2